MRLSDFDFELPEELIAQEPLAERDASRLLHLPRSRGDVIHRHVRDLPSLLRPGDLLVFNDARVIPARLRGTKAATGGKVELLLVEPRGTGADGKGERWFCLGQASKGLRAGTVLALAGGLEGVVVGPEEDGLVVDLSKGGDALLAALWEAGEIPLPPYIRHAHVPASEDPDAARYQTIFAKRPGASAAPTAGLHFTERLLEALRARGIGIATLTLYVGPGTFLPVRTDDVSQHRMHAEGFDIPAATVAAVARTRAKGGRVVAVGTTSLRALEAATDASGALAAGPGRTDIFITPGYAFRQVDALFTNFHLPKSTLLMLVSAIAGRERILAAYAEAVRERYRFFSYGDAMLVE